MLALKFLAPYAIIFLALGLFSYLYVTTMNKLEPCPTNKSSNSGVICCEKGKPKCHYCRTIVS